MFKTAILTGAVLAASFSSIVAARADFDHRGMSRMEMRRHMMHDRMMHDRMMHRRMVHRAIRHDL